ncbi:MAG: peptidylprolyl isomerase [Gemmatimonadales bacterium]|nr:peptidylprolyl isomerase [Gemmatimonadales bacterium]
MPAPARAATVALILAVSALAARPAAAQRVIIETAVGAITVQLDSARAPSTVANFLRYVDAGAYDGGRFHRTVTRSPDNQPRNTVKIDVIQGGADSAKAAALGLGPIALERTSVTGLRHVRGAISMARGGPDTATSDFFLCLADEPSLDFGGQRNPDGQGFAAFGRVTAGLDVAERIHLSPVMEQRLAPPIGILKVRRAP